MSQKRQPEEPKSGSETNSPDEKRRRFNLKTVVQEVIKMQSVHHLLEPILEPLIRRVVKEEVELALKKHLASFKRNSGDEKDSSESRSLKLQFSNNLSLPVFTGARIEGEEYSAIKVALIDILTGKIVNSGPEASAKVEIVVLEDNSSWTRSRRFRLGARVVDNFDGTNVRETKTESFIVRDHRGELYKKHHPPSLFDEVWRLEKIGKDGAFHKRLSRENINTVKDFLTQLFIDPQRLRHVLGTGMSAKMWEVTVEHARTCVLDKRMYLHYTPGSQQKSGVVFNVVGQVVGLLSDCQYVPVDKLSETEKASQLFLTPPFFFLVLVFLSFRASYGQLCLQVDAQNLVIAAFEHPQEVISFDDEESLVDGSSNLSNIPYPSSSPRTENSNGSKVLASHKMGGFDYAQPNAASPDIISSMYSVGSVSSLDDYALHSIENMGLRYDQTLSFPGQVSNPLICDTDAMTQAFCDEDHLRFFDTEFQSQNLSLEAPADLQSALDGFLLTRSTAVAVDRAQRRWTKISSVLKWFSIRRRVASKKTCVREIHRY
ncbi:hypothetical protein GH714_043313 [Hevea brasiliensis]|uniref:Uncharacterized protein n=1 Tax=Hevea brasiliensis TaxID=3981 RepID=A0A6A6K3L6_HEVBR|nr:hypothetical protein GH714_043313 [Hevea brasiliensis]